MLNKRGDGPKNYEWWLTTATINFVSTDVKVSVKVIVRIYYLILRLLRGDDEVKFVCPVSCCLDWVMDESVEHHSSLKPFK